MSQQTDDLRALAKIMDFLRAVSIILVVVHLYWYGYEAVRQWGIDIGVVDRMLVNFDRTAGLFHHILYTKLFALLLLALSCLGTKGVKEEKITWGRIWAVLAAGLALFFLNWWMLSLPLPVEANVAFYAVSMVAGYVCLLMSGTWMSRLLRTNLMDDVFNVENESFMQETRLMENEYSVNLPTRFYYKKKWNDGYINVVNPFRATIVLGTPGSGKSYAVVNSFIKQQIEKGFSLYCYDFKYPDLSTIAYNHLMNHGDGYKVKPKFYVINFDDPRRSHRCNPIHPDFMEDITAQFEQDLGAKTGRLLCGKSDYSVRCNYLVLTDLSRREVLHFSPCHRTVEPPLRGRVSYFDQLPGIGELSFPVHGRLAGRRDGTACRTDSLGEDTALAHDFAPALLGHVRQRVYAGY